MAAAKVLALTVYLLKKDSEDAFEKRHPAASRDVKALPDDLEGWCLPIQPSETVPQWAAALDEFLGDDCGLVSRSPSALLVLKRSGRTYVVTFGHAWQRLENEWLERDFGRRVALNLIHPEKLLEIRTEQVFAAWHVAMDRAPRASTVDQFGVEFDRDLVGAVEGVPSDEKKFGRTIRGGTSLRVLSTLAGLPSFLDRCEKLFKSEKYKAHWPDIDNLGPVKDPKVVADLESLLDGELSSGKAVKKLVLFTPSYRRDEPMVVDSYVFGKMSQAPVTRPYLAAEQWFSFLKGRGGSPSLHQARQTKVHLLDGDGNEGRACSIFDCFGYEVSLGGRPYVLSSGTWYEVESKFLDRVNRVVNGIKPVKIRLPAWNQTDSEGDYNAACCKEDGYALFDTKNVMYGGGQSKFEFCDVLHLESKSLIFAKIVSKSAGMSHLVEQVRRTAELFFGGDAGYRGELRKLVKKRHPNLDSAWTGHRALPGEWNICLVSLGRSSATLPFFAKCGVMKLVNELRRSGHNISFSHV